MSLKPDFSTLSIGETEAEIGRRLEALRLQENISQAELAAEAGVSRRTITRFENGGGVSLETLIRLMRALGIAHRLDTLLPEPSVRPIDRIRLAGKQRQRARKKTGDDQAEWSWGDGSEDQAGND